MIPPTFLLTAHPPGHSLSARRAFVRRLIKEAAHRSRTRCARFVRRRGGREVLEIWWRESSFNPRARNRSGAMGLAGMRQNAWRMVGVSPSWDPHRQAQAFFKYIDAHPVYRGDPGRALATLRRRGTY